MITPTELKPYILNDPLIVWLKRYHRDLAEKDPYQTYLATSGIQFEKTTLETLSQKHPIYSIPRGDRAYELTAEAMRNKVPIIYSGHLRSEKLGMYGIADLLIRSDYFHREFFPNTDAPLETTYIVVDIKMVTLPFRADGVTLLNKDDVPFYKSQLWCYANMAGSTAPYGFIMGKKGELARVDFDEEIEAQTMRAIEWVNRVIREGSSWCLSPPSVPELYPNMCYVDNDWQRVKKTLALQVGEITYVWQCGLKHRESAWRQGVYSFYDPRCTSAVLGFTGERAQVIDKILEINRNPALFTGLPKLPNVTKGKRECFLDFETVHLENGTFIFMAGVGWFEGSFQYRSWVLESATLEAERKLIQDVIAFLSTFEVIWYWFADQGIYQSALSRHGLSSPIDKQVWQDLAKIFLKQPIVLPGCYKFGLKDIAKALYANNLITTKLEGECQSGISALLSAIEVYTGRRNMGEVMPTLVHYNCFDVTILHEMLGLIRG